MAYIDYGVVSLPHVARTSLHRFDWKHLFYSAYIGLLSYTVLATLFKVSLCAILRPSCKFGKENALISRYADALWRGNGRPALNLKPQRKHRVVYH